MRTFNYLLLAVASPARSAELYTNLLGIAPVENSPTFVLYVMPNGVKIGLWAADEMKPVPRPAGGVEISFTEASKEAVSATYDAWKAAGRPDCPGAHADGFGFTFVAEDLDGNRLRPFVLADQPR